jgi:hypothetical protein
VTKCTSSSTLQTLAVAHVTEKQLTAYSPLSCITRCNAWQVMMMELLQTRLEQESMRSDLTAALTAIRELPSAIARKGEGAAAMWGPDGGDLFEQVEWVWGSRGQRGRGVCKSIWRPFSTIEGQGGRAGGKGGKR